MSLTLKDQLPLLIEKHRLNVSRLAELTNVNVQTLHNWIGGQNPKNIEQVKAIADFFGVSLEYLCFGETHRQLDSINEYKDEINAGIFEVVLRRVKK